MSTRTETGYFEPAPKQQDESGITETESAQKMRETAKVAHGWEFFNTPPTVAEVDVLLRSLGSVYGVNVYEYADHVQALPQKKKTKRPHPTNPKIMVDENVDVWILYMSVAGRVAMLRDAAAVNQWRVDIRPEPTTPTGLPGYLNVEQRLVFRSYIDISERNSVDGVEQFLGSRYGTAWVPATGGSGAASSNPYEVVETSALGRALAAWGFGVLPGSGIASVEEMAVIAQNRDHLNKQVGQEKQSGNRPPREELVEGAMALMEQVRLARRYSEPAMTESVGRYLTDRLGVVGAYDDKNVTVQWERVKDGQLSILANSFRDTLRSIAEAESDL